MEIGAADALEHFRARHERFFEYSADLERVIEVAFGHTVNTQDRVGLVIVLLGTRCVRDFREILLLAANGFGWGATAQLRGMFERLVTAAYLHENPEKVDDFVEYEFVRRWKGLQAVEQTFGLPPELEKVKTDVASDFRRVRNRFLIPTCEKCQTTHVNHTWSRLHVVAMAGKVHRLRLAPFLVPAYYLPLAQAHSTLTSISSRIGEINPGVFGTDEAKERLEADRTVKYAHLLLLEMLTIQHERFQLIQLGPLMDRALAHFQYAWSSENDVSPE